MGGDEPELLRALGWISGLSKNTNFSSFSLLLLSSHRQTMPSDQGELSMRANNEHTAASAARSSTSEPVPETDAAAERRRKIEERNVRWRNEFAERGDFWREVFASVRNRDIKRMRSLMSLSPDLRLILEQIDRDSDMKMTSGGAGSQPRQQEGSAACGAGAKADDGPSTSAAEPQPNISQGATASYASDPASSNEPMRQSGGR
ncbi:hypothetical protein FJU08_13025 [Martelella alba]|uniref:Uncharacterized protein n=1 Tax=Martelella alba TaxID=2590451 RepID=A0A506U8B4_9HYPH|nr:hypothetical protein [Martelella alba]TPW29728.1 hypothetical protein FJU08_13025 [Martelella alba]